VLVTAVNGESATDSMLNDQQDNTTSVMTTCGVTRLQHCIHPLTAYLTQSPVEELQVLFPVYSHTVLDTVCRLVSDIPSVTCYSVLLPVMT